MPNAISVHDVARYFLALQSEEAGMDISNLKLQKLCYYAQGFSLALRGTPLFTDKIKAWEHGPVVPDLWHRYKEFGDGTIPPVRDLQLERYQPDVRDLLDEVYEVYGQFSAWKLREMTHDEPPWADTPKGGEITHERMASFFKTLVK